MTTELEMKPFFTGTSDVLPKILFRAIVRDGYAAAPLFEEPGLLEMDLGAFEGMEAKLWFEKYPHFLKDWRETPSAVKMPGGESLQEVQTRAIDTLERITQKYPPQSTLLFCSHNFVNRTILCHAMGKSLDRFRELQQGTAALNILYKQNNTLWAEVIDDRSHLQSNSSY